LLESDSSVISDVVKVFYDLKKVFEEQNLNNSVFLKSEEKKVLTIFENRCEGKFVSNHHYLAFYLDPRYRDLKVIESDERLVAIVYKTLESYANALGLIECRKDRDDLSDSIDNFRNSENLYAIPLLAGRSPLKYWKHYKSFPKTAMLAKIGARLSSIPASSAGVERSFSTQKRIHTQVRNRLSDKNIDKIMRIQWSLNCQLNDERALIEVDDNENIGNSDEVELDIDELIILEEPFTEDELNQI